ncbi:putative FYVE zinc finger, chaperonin Cpn60/GroEL/TCP-1 family, Zinc finger, FYVE/PHD-type [Septoria linicola]|nr:putative FYVE zinc finger, chaperonin Cpn60/GroEL/TCP-1 family, Zinc finger, FYVE/PHD-type [Septoria linicola]
MAIVESTNTTSINSPGASSALMAPFIASGRSRRGSLASISSKKGVDKETLAQALDEIHTTASRSDGLTSFHDFDGEGRSSGAKELVSNGISGMYNRLRQSVAGGGGGAGGGSASTSSGSVRDRDIGRSRPKSIESRESLDTGSVQSVPSSPLTTRSRTQQQLNARKPASADQQSVASLNVPASPLVRNPSSHEQSEGKSGTPQLHLHTADGQPIPAVGVRVSREPSVDSARAPATHSLAKTKSAPDVPTKEDVEKARSAWNGDRSAEGTDALARVLSHHEVSLTDQPKQISQARLRDDLEEAIEDSDYADDPEPLFPAPSQPLPPPAAASNPQHAASEARQPRRPPMLRVGVSHLPGFDPSRTSSTMDGSEGSSAPSSRATSYRKPSVEPAANMNTALGRKRSTLKSGSVSDKSQSSSSKQRHVLDRKFWMQDEGARVCFSCGQSFSTFRRKHHCRSCGQIFDAKCTSLHPGRQFGQASDVRLCKLCESVIMGSDDDSTVFSDEDRDDYTRSPLAHNSRADHDEMIGRLDGSAFSRTDVEVMTPSIGIPVSRRNREAKRRSAVIEFDDSRTLARPGSSHSLISLSRRPRSSSHRRRHSKHHPSSRLVRSSVDIERGPFHQGVAEDVEKRQLPTFHKDNIIDPDLADYLSDDGSEDGQHQSIMAALEGPSASPGERDKLGFAGLLSSAFTKGRSRGTDRRLAQGSSIHGDKAEESRTVPVRPRSRHLSDIPVARAAPRASQSNLVPQSNAGEMLPRPRTPSGQTTYAKVTCSPALQQNRPTDDLELYPASEEHMRKLLAQLLGDAQVPHSRAWQQALLPVLMQCTNDVEPDVQAGDDMDIRHYIKLKKIPGGKPRDTGYVSGIVFSKNIALKSMARTLANPKILIVNFSIEYARHEAHFMSLEPILAQETEYLKNLVKRIAQLRPDVLLVQKHVSGKALLMLEEENITVAYNIKESVLAAIARVTMTSPVKSVEKLTMMSYDNLGICDSFDVKTYVTDGLRKTYIYLSGCQPDLGCTVVLRGADTKILRKIKRIAEFMCYVAYSLKLENSLMRDEFVSIPRTVDSQDGTHRHINDAVPAEDRQLTINETLQQEIEKGNANLHFKYEEQERESRKRILSASPFVIFMQPYLLTQLRDLERRLATYKMLRDQYAAADEDGDDVSNEKDELEIKENFSLVKPDMVNAPASKDQPKAVREYLHAVHEAQLQKAKHTFEVQERQWESFQNGEVNPFDPFSHQKIVVLYSTVSSITSAPCTGPELLGLGFYASYGRTDPYHEDDLTLGQYIQEMCAAAVKTCGDCSKKMSDHHRQYVHGYGQLTVSTQRQQTKVRGMHDQILMWSTCRLCRHETTVTQMSSHTWKYSFAKYLELSFWSSHLHPRAGLCKHDIHRDFLRCFGFHDTVVRVQYDPIDIYDVTVPKAQVTWKVEADLTVKNEQYQLFEERLRAFISSVRQRLDMITVDNVNEKTAEAAYALVEELRMKLEVDERELKEKLQLKYAKSRYYELIPLNRALRFMDEKAIAWDDEFERFEEKYFPSEADIRKIAVDQMRKMFLESQPARGTIGSEAGSDTEDGFETSNARRAPHARDELLRQKAQDVLSSAMEEHTAAADENDPLRPVKSHDPSGLLGTELVRVTTPRKELEEAVERDDVKHLDLAVPTQSPPPVLVGDTLDELSPRKSPEDASEHDSQTEEPFAIQPKPLSSGLLEKIEQIRNNKASTGADEVPETRIPRLADLQQKQRDASPSPAARPVPPPLLRAKSQPGHPGHAHRLSADATMNNPSIDAVTTSQEQPGEGENHGIDKRLGDRLGVGRLTNKAGKIAPSFIPRSIPAKHEESFPSTVSALAKHFEQMSREFEKERLKERRQRATRSRQARANPLASSRPVVEVYQNAVDAVGERPPTVQELELEQERERAVRREMDEIVAQNQPEDHSISEADKHALDDDEHVLAHEAEASTLAGDTIVDADDEMSDNEHGLSRSRDTSDPSSSLQSPSTTGPDLHDLGPDGQIGEQRKNQWFKYLAEFWSKRSASGWGNLEYPLHATEHVFEDSDIIVREDEPSSVIALSLACADYQVKEKGFRKAPNRQPLAKHGHAHSTSTASTANLSGAEGQRADIEASLLGDVATHMKYSFAHGQVKASCKIFYAESFDALRRRCGVADRFMESMSRCLKFDSKGGKTKSLFLRTLDSRFIIKSLQEVELKAFTKFAPDYFNFMSYTLFHGVPSVIAKMFGLFQVNIRNPATGVDFSYYLLVMENLFYERSPDRRFDLKGSMRNRKIEATGQADEVLLDENLVETIFESPLFVREHSRKLLQASVFNDTLWLCKQNVMDYSLMAGFDDTRKELVVGIIDCIRTYTWDKKLESWIKDRGKNKPTITSPKDYRNRFRVSMMQYVLQAPNCWWSFQVNLGMPKTLREGEGQGATVEGDVTETGDDMS